MAHCNHGCRWSRLNLVDLAPTVVDEIVIPLHYALEFLHVFAVLATPCIMRSNSAMFATSISATSVQYRSAQTSVMTRIFGMPTLALSFAIARNFSTKGRTFPGLQYMISRMRSMRVLPCVGWVQAAAGRLTHRG